MKHLKILGLCLVAAAALMSFGGAGTASATVLSGSSGNLGVGTEIDADVEGTAILKAGFQEVKCTEGTIKGSISNAGGASATVSGSTSNVSFVAASCNCEPITVSNGTLEIHYISGTKGTLTASGFTATVTCNSIFGKVTCRYITGNNKDMGTLTGSNETGGTATMDVNTSLTREEVSSGLCAESAEWNATYKVTTPDVLNVTAS